MASPLIASFDLAETRARLTILDVRYRMAGPGGPQEYAAGHVPGATYVDLDAELAGAPGVEGRHPLPALADFQSAMRRAGVRDDRPVVVYDDWSGHAAGRAWWLLRHHGHPDVRVLDGGWSTWVAEGGEVETGTRDQVEPVDPVAGHVPGAVNVPTSANLAPDGRFRSTEELRALYAAAGVAVDGVTEGTHVGVYCGSGVTATHDLLALEIIGVRAALYPGSWSEWVTDPARPVARSS